MHRALVLVAALLALGLGTLAVSQAASGSSATGTAAAAKKPKCKKGFSAHKVSGKYRCLKRPKCRTTQTVKLKGRKLVCVARKKAPTPTPTPTPAPQPTPTPDPAITDPKARATALIQSKLFTKYTTTASPSGSGTSRDTRYAFCANKTFQYSYEFTSDQSPDLYRKDTAQGTWVVSQAEFNDQAQAMRAIVDYTVQQTNNPEIVSGQLLIEALGDKAYIGGDEFGYQAINC